MADWVSSLKINPKVFETRSALPSLPVEALAPEDPQASLDVAVAAFAAGRVVKLCVEQPLRTLVETSRQVVEIRCALPIPSKQSLAPEELQALLNVVAPAFLVNRAIDLAIEWALQKSVNTSLKHVENCCALSIPYVQ